MKYLFTVDYWDPESEGGMINVIASSEPECIVILSEEETFPEDHQHLIPEKVLSANKLSLLDEYDSGIIDAFIL